MKLIQNGIQVSDVPNNIFRGILPVAALFDTPPSDLPNVTDGDNATVTGTGTTALGASGLIGNVTIDVGTIKTLLIGSKVGIWSSAASVNVSILSSNDNAMYTSGSSIVASTTSVGENIVETLAKVLTGRYFKFNFSLSGAGTGNVKIYTINAWELNI